LMAIDVEIPRQLQIDGVVVEGLSLSARDEAAAALRQRYLSSAPGAIYLMRPDQHVAARWLTFDEAKVRAALKKAIGKA
jgi:3-(3-hydroxy-phenyl)propionate hydroxylase